MIRDDIKAALVTAMKAGDKPKTATIRLIQAAIKNRDIEARTGKAPDDDDLLVTEVLQKMVKQRKDSLEIFQQQSRPELAQKEIEEIAVIEKFLPQQMDEVALRSALAGIISKVGATTAADMGKVMGAANKELAGKADGKTIAAIVKELLASS